MFSVLPGWGNFFSRSVFHPVFIVSICSWPSQELWLLSYDFHILLSHMSTLLSPHQHLYACGRTAKPHNYQPPRRFPHACFCDRLFFFFFFISVVKYLLRALVRLLYNKIPRGGGLNEDYSNGRMGCILRLAAHCGLVPHCLLIYLDAPLYFYMTELAGASSYI